MVRGAYDQIVVDVDGRLLAPGAGRRCRPRGRPPGACHPMVATAWRRAVRRSVCTPPPLWRRLLPMRPLPRGRLPRRQWVARSGSGSGIDSGNRSGSHSCTDSDWACVHRAGTMPDLHHRLLTPSRAPPFDGQRLCLRAVAHRNRGRGTPPPPIAQRVYCTDG